MRVSVIRNTAFFSILGLGNTQDTSSSWGEPFNVDVSTDSLLGSSQQPLTNIVGTNTPSTTGLAPLVPITGEFSVSIPTELSTMSTRTPTVVVTSTASRSGSASASASTSTGAASSRASSSGSPAASQSSGAAAPMGIHGQQKVMGVAGALAGAAGVLFV